MKDNHCNWVDVQKDVPLLVDCPRGTQARLERLRCLSHSAVNNLTTACQLLKVVNANGNSHLSNDSPFTPTHGLVVMRSLRRQHGRNINKWPEEAKEQIVEWIEHVEDEKLTVEQLREKLAAPAKKEQLDSSFVLKSLEEAVDKGLSFGTVYADPPWQYDNQATRAATSNHYGTLSVAEIAALPVPKLVAEKACLFLWTTGAFLPHSFGIIEAWGFEYKTYAVWYKPQLGIGNYFRKSTELLLLGTRGSYRFPKPVETDWFKHDRIGHSRKPELFRKLIESVAPPPWLEMFGRRLANGWYVWGNQIEQTLFDPVNDIPSSAEPTLFPETEATAS
jgi:N6-adenosine-specific RNA methylase IME4